MKLPSVLLTAQLTLSPALAGKTEWRIDFGRISHMLQHKSSAAVNAAEDFFKPVGSYDLKKKHNIYDTTVSSSSSFKIVFTPFLIAFLNEETPGAAFIKFLAICNRTFLRVAK